MDGSVLLEFFLHDGVGTMVVWGGLLGRCPIMPVKDAFSSESFVARGGRIPAPVRSLTN